MSSSPESRAERFCAYASAVELLRQRFGSEQVVLGDVLDRFDLERAEPWDRLVLQLPELAEVLLPLRLRIVLEARVHGTESRLRLHRAGRDVQVEIERWENTATPPTQQLTAEGVEAYRAFGRELGGGGSMAPLQRVLDRLGGLGRAGVELDLRLQIALDDKRALARRFASAGDPARAPKPLVFLFPEALARYLASRSLARLEAESFEPERRTVFLVFGFDGGFGNDLLAVVGTEWVDRLDRLLTAPLLEETQAEGAHVRELHAAGGVWLERHAWLRPEIFDQRATSDRPTGSAAGVLEQFRLLRALLAAIFLSDHAEAVAGEADGEDAAEQRIKFRGDVDLALGISRAELAGIDGEDSLWTDHETTARIDDLYSLYRYAYEGFRVDKLEIAQQFVSLMVRDLPGLCTEAAKVEEATRQTYHRSLQKGVAEYFDALQKIQDRIKSAVDETSDSVLGLTREVSGDLYKVAGLSLGALVGAFLEPDLTPIALLTAAAGIALYATLVIALHLPTFERTYAIRLEQHRSYIRSFDKVLPKRRLDGFLGDDLLQKAQGLLQVKLRSARWVYGAALAVACLVAFGAAVELACP